MINPKRQTIIVQQHRCIVALRKNKDQESVYVDGNFVIMIIGCFRHHSSSFCQLYDLASGIIKFSCSILNGSHIKFQNLFPSRSHFTYCHSDYQKRKKTLNISRSSQNLKHRTRLNLFNNKHSLIMLAE